MDCDEGETTADTIEDEDEEKQGISATELCWKVLLSVDGILFKQ